MALNVNNLELANIQSNILCPHHKDFVKCIFLKFNENTVSELRNWICRFADNTNLNGLLINNKFLNHDFDRIHTDHLKLESLSKDDILKILNKIDRERVDINLKKLDQEDMELLLETLTSQDLKQILDHLDFDELNKKIKGKTGKELGESVKDLDLKKLDKTLNNGGEDLMHLIWKSIGLDDQNIGGLRLKLRNIDLSNLDVKSLRMILTSMDLDWIDLKEAGVDPSKVALKSMDLSSIDLDTLRLKSKILNDSNLQNRKPGGTKLKELNSRITNAKLQEIYYRLYEAEKGDSVKVTDLLFNINFFLSASGYEKLGVPRDQWPNDPSFLTGMKSFIPQSLVHDNLEDWDDIYCEERNRICFDAMILIAHGDSSQVGLKAEEILNRLEGKDSDSDHFGTSIIKAYHEEDGSGIRRGGYPREHFGYRDGITQPVFRDKSTREYNRSNFDMVLVEEAGPGNEAGSYFVFRKMWQNVTKFDRKIEELANKLSEANQALMKKDALRLAEAQVMGRDKDGVPLIFIDELVNGTMTPDQIKEIFDNFDPSPTDMTDPKLNIYEKNEATELKCPFHAHIRKVNPRVNDPKVRFESYDGNYSGKIEARIVRRGIPYDNRRERKGSENYKPGDDVGILFMSYQASIKQQFERICKWSNSSAFAPGKTTGRQIVGIDPVAGQINDFTKQRYYSGQKGEDDIKYLFSKVVKSKGGEYFFTPSIPFLKSLCNKGFNQNETLEQLAAIKKKVIVRILKAAKDREQEN